MLSGFENPVHILIVLAVALLLFGAKRLPELGRSLGGGMREFKNSITGVTTVVPADADATSDELTTAA